MLGDDLQASNEVSKSSGKFTDVTPDESRVRINSLRNGEASKVIENIDIEAPKMEKQQIEDYLRWK